MEKTLVGWVFRVEVVVNNPAILTAEMKQRLMDAFGDIEDIDMVLIEEMFEDIKLFQQKKGGMKDE